MPNARNLPARGARTVVITTYTGTTVV